MDCMNKIYKLSPYPELIMRWVYYKILKPFLLHGTGIARKECPKTVRPSVSINDFMDRIKSFGVSKGDFVIVHSSANGLSNLKCAPNELLEALIDLVGETGTIAMPAFPDEDRLKIKNGLKIYDPNRSVAWTGMLPNLLLRKKKACRSFFPYNPLVAFGLHAKKMMEHNLETEFAHGEKSCWDYCLRHHAKILYLGLPAYHSFTILHSVEDYNHYNWLPEDWYVNRKYIVKTETGEIVQNVKVRADKWSMFLAEKHSEQKYICAGLMQSDSIDGIELRFVPDAAFFVETIEKKWDKMRCYYLPRKYKRTMNEGKM